MPSPYEPGPDPDVAVLKRILRAVERDEFEGGLCSDALIEAFAKASLEYVKHSRYRA